MFTKLDSQSLYIYLELLSMKGIEKSITLQGVRDPRFKSKKFCGPKKTHGHVYHLDLEFSDRSRD